MSVRQPVFPSLAHVLRHRAERTPDALAHCFLADGEIEGASLTYRQLHERACAIAALLEDRGLRPGDRAVLLYPPGLDFVAGFFGALYARVIAVPAYPPAPASVTRSVARLASIVGDCAPAAVLCAADIANAAGDIGAHCQSLDHVPWLTPALAETARAATWTPGDVDAATVAFLQYTSGSTASPRGVIVSHGNLLHNLSVSSAAAGSGADSVSLSWLPVIHDMGLIDGTLAPVFGGFPAYVMSPTAFLQRPVRWLDAITRYRVTNSGGPNFAYDLCVRRVTATQRERLDLSAWRAAYNGAEPIRADTLERFHAAFRACGFRWRAFFPVYGLAEATLAVSSGGLLDEPRCLTAGTDALASGRLVTRDASGGGRRTRLVGTGPALGDTTVAIVDPASRMRCPSDTVGEIWISSSSVAGGYWNRPSESREVFGARLADGGGPYLRTGDLGVLRDGELFVVGRIKDVLIVRGSKYHPQDLEATVEREHDAIRPGRTAAFAIDADDGGGPRVVVASEVDPRRLCATRESRHRLLSRAPLCPATHRAVDGVTRAVREAIAREHGIQLHGVALLPPGELPLTSSGKVRRHACARGWVTGDLGCVARWVRQDAGETESRLVISA